MWLWPATDHEPHCSHVPINKIWRWTESTPRSGWWCSHMAAIYSNCSTREIHQIHHCVAHTRYTGLNPENNRRIWNVPLSTLEQNNCRVEVLAHSVHGDGGHGNPMRTGINIMGVPRGGFLWVQTIKRSRMVWKVNLADQVISLWTCTNVHRVNCDFCWLVSLQLSVLRRICTAICTKQ